jgi:hypothetical protein
MDIKLTCKSFRTAVVGLKLLFSMSLLVFCLASCFKSDDGTSKISMVAQVTDTAIAKTTSMGVLWCPYIDDDGFFRFKASRLPDSEMVEADGYIRFMGWAQSDEEGFKAGLLRYLVDEPGFLMQIYKRPFTAFGQDFNQFEDFGAEYYRVYAGSKLRPFRNGQYISLQDSTISAFSFDTDVDFGGAKRTPEFIYADKLDDKNENSLLRVPARILYLSHKQYNFRIIVELNNPLATGILNSLVFF